MKALVSYGERDVRFEEAQEPEPGEGEVIFDVELPGICGSDLHGYRGHPGPPAPPLVLGHEVVGRVGETYTLYPRDFARAVDILAEGDLDLGWLSDSRLTEDDEAFANLVDRSPEYAKVLLSSS